MKMRNPVASAPKGFATPRPTTNTFLITFTTLLLLPIYAQAQSNWEQFPADSRPCLDSNARLSGCPGTTTDVYTYLVCLCGNNQYWVNDAAACINQAAPGSLENVWNTMYQTCASWNLVLNIDFKTFMAAAGSDSSTGDSRGSETTTAGTSSSTSAPKTTETYSTNSPGSTTKPGDGEGSGGGGLSTSDKIAIGIGVPAGVFTIIGGIVSWWRCCRPR